MSDATPARRVVEVDGVATSVIELGSGHPLLLVHGSGPAISSYFSFQAVTGELAKDFRLILVDMPGYGGSAPIPGPDTPPNVARHLVRVLDVLGYGAVHVAGHSRGGRIACELAVLAPERVTRLIVIGSGSVAPGGHVGEDGGWTAPALALTRWGSDGDISFESLSDAYMTQVLRKENLPERWLRAAYEEAAESGRLEHFVRAMNVNDPLAFYHQKNAQEFHDKLARLSTPTLVLWGREDTCSPYQKAVPLVDLMKNIDLVILPECEHFVMMDRPRAFVGVTREFLLRPAESAPEMT
ncbi:alpha/beta fold hydrolase [Acrocarpospora catenulata]|uniref:alpha/beta fold hydrolase n=1 Tax=Acrocarpospora catenulata TaxID=2836182 RepID=UPI001BDA82C7|nr:alpha/beta hydrolase [Acrocarpospora catenulata]